jgi:hypothetical protein
MKNECCDIPPLIPKKRVFHKKCQERNGRQSGFVIGPGSSRPKTVPSPSIRRVVILLLVHWCIGAMAPHRGPAFKMLAATWDVKW